MRRTNLKILFLLGLTVVPLGRAEILKVTLRADGLC